MFDAGIAVEVPVGPDCVHLFPEGQNLWPRNQGIRIAMTHQNARFYRIVCGKRGFQHPMEAAHGNQILPGARHLQYRHSPQTEAYRQMG